LTSEYPQGIRRLATDLALADDMPDDDDKPEPIPFVVDVAVDRTRVQVTLLLKPGTAVTVAETKITTEPRLTAMEDNANANRTRQSFCRV
jgi:hypothetical protein